MSDSRWRNFSVVVRRALRQPFSVGVLAAGALLSILTVDGIPFGAAVVAVAVYIAVKLRDESFIRAAFSDQRQRQTREDRRDRTFRIEELDVESRVRMKSIVKLQKEIAEDVANSPVDEVAAGLADTVEQAEQMVDRGLAMAQKRRDLQRYLRNADPAAIEARIHSLETKLASETDPVRKSETEAALTSKRQELEDHKQIEQAAARVLDQLDAIECSFQSLKTKLVLIKSTDIDEWTAANTELRGELGALTSAADVVEQSIQEVLSTRGGE